MCVSVGCGVRALSCGVRACVSVGCVRACVRACVFAHFYGTEFLSFSASHVKDNNNKRIFKICCLKILVAFSLGPFGWPSPHQFPLSLSVSQCLSMSLNVSWSSASATYQTNSNQHVNQ